MALRYFVIARMVRWFAARTHHLAVGGAESATVYRRMIAIIDAVVKNEPQALAKRKPVVVKLASSKRPACGGARAQRKRPSHS